MELHIAFDQANHFSAIVIPKEESGSTFWTVVILAAEDDCLGIDFNPAASAICQPLLSSTDTISDAFETRLRGLTEENRQDINNDPKVLVWLYAELLVQTVACHVELFHREWNVLYGPHANTSAVYGDARDRDIVRRLDREFLQHLRYLDISMERDRKSVV